MAPVEMKDSDPLFDIDGQVCVIAGAGGGLGKVFARALAERGVKLALLDIDEKAIERLASEIPGACTAVVGVDDESALDSAFGEIAETLGPVNSAIYMAGVLPIAPALELDEAAFRLAMDVNVTGGLLFSRAAHRAMEGRGGRIVHMASVSSTVANPNYVAYSTSKAAIAQMVRVLAREWAPDGVLVNAIGPAMTETPMNAGYLADPDFHAAALSVIPLGRLGLPEDLIGTLVMLLAPAGGFITGQIIYVDGGRTLV